MNNEKYYEILITLKARFENNMIRHPDIKWDDVESKILINKKKPKSTI
jgi:hypothetical protein